ncbi:MAG: YggT family protein [Rhizonema sp. PD38]|nr:YggT family protein [Rhizonema sp. PD38]
MTHSVALLINTLVTLITIYMYMLVIRVLLGWFPNINWLAPPFSILSQLTDPFLKVFRSIIPPLGGRLDISPILAILLLQLLRGLLSRIVM